MAQNKSKTYVLLRDQRPISFILQSKSSKRKPLLVFDTETNRNRSIRYAVNQKSIFEDEQDGTAMLEPVIFEDGMLYASAENQILQLFLDRHPENGKAFEERDPEKDAIKRIAEMEREEEAIISVKNLNLDQLKTLVRIGSREDVNKLTASEIKHNARVMARNQPNEVLRILNDPLLKVQDLVARAFENGILYQKGKQRDVYFKNTKNPNRAVASRILSIPPGENHIFTMAKWLQGNDGLQTLNLINELLAVEEEI